MSGRLTRGNPSGADFEELTQEFGDDRALLVQRQHVVGQVVVVPESSESVRQLQQSLSTGSSAVAACEWARGAILQAHA